VPREGYKVIDRGWNKIQKNASKLAGGIAASVGVQGTKAGQTSVEHGGMTNAELGAIHEFGTRNKLIPERPHFRTTFDENVQSYQRKLDKIGRDFFGGQGNVKGGLLLLGEDYRRDIIERIQAGQLRELAESTKKDRRQKQRGRGAELIPLLVTGQYINALSVDVGPR
jgi:hypothetical protein